MRILKNFRNAHPIVVINDNDLAPRQAFPIDNNVNRFAGQPVQRDDRAETEVEYIPDRFLALTNSTVIWRHIQNQLIRFPAADCGGSRCQNGHLDRQRHFRLGSSRGSAGAASGCAGRTGGVRLSGPGCRIFSARRGVSFRALSATTGAPGLDRAALRPLTQNGPASAADGVSSRRSISAGTASDNLFLLYRRNQDRYSFRQSSTFRGGVMLMGSLNISHRVAMRIIGSRFADRRKMQFR